MSCIDFAPVPLSLEDFDGDWQTQIGLNIRLAAITLGKTKDELRTGFIADPEAMAVLAESLSGWADKLAAYHAMLNSAMARVLVVGCEVDGIPLEDEAGE